MLRTLGKHFFERLERVFDAAFGQRGNPFHHLGALGWYFFWIVLATGVYLYIFFDTGMVHAYQSIEVITHTQWYAGGVMRSLHRYASDALVIVVFMHLVREWVKDRYRGARWFAWFTGVPLLWFIYLCGISGYWLVWDELAQYIAVTTTEWLDTLGIFGEPVARNFLSSEALTDRFFTLMVFVHIIVPLFMLFLMWVHIQRNANANINPPRAMMFGTLATMTALSLADPALSHAPANLDRVVVTINLDWFYLPAYPLLEVIPGRWLWALLGFGTLALMLLPWAPPRRQPAAVVNLPSCNGCGRCHADCPFTAIEMKPRSDGLAFEQEAVVDPAICVSCGVCAGACPTSTPHRRVGELVPGIDLPDLGIRLLRDRTVEACAALKGENRVVIYGCEHGPAIESLAGEGVAAVRLRCSGQLPPAFVDFVLARGHADGVLIAGCRQGDCHHRMGIDWTQQRLARTRDPMLRARVPEERIATAWCGMSGLSAATRELAQLRERLRKLGPYRRAHAVAHKEATHEG